MIHPRTGTRFATVALLLALSGGEFPVAATETLQRDVAGSAGGWCAGGGYVLGLTVGEGVVGLAQAVSVREWAGFWGMPFTAVLDAPAPPAPEDAAPALEILPNPFVASTRIRWTRIPRAGAAEARVVIFDAGGRRVRDLAGAPSGPGERTFRWDGRDARGREVGAGLYFCRIVHGSDTVVRRLVRIR